MSEAARRCEQLAQGPSTIVTVDTIIDAVRDLEMFQANTPHAGYYAGCAACGGLVNVFPNERLRTPRECLGIRPEAERQS